MIVILAVVVAGVAAVAGVRWLTAGEPVLVAAPDGASEQLPEGRYETVVDLRTSEVHHDLRTDRGPATVNTYLLPPSAAWDQIRSGVAGQLPDWEQTGDCLDTGEKRIRCRWTESAFWSPRRVEVVFLRPPTNPEDRAGWPDNTFLVIGSGRG
ncbi:hypothetical protein GCM10009828_021150 [Actinoplanes couchii]|uniref:Uncharacterized protein n=2 Tax=Actinoplanes couchii TaxID=403638 RepID=A0ABQ3XHT5_9ACTN|nr:hypothetical protein Aco03nite_064670 [Actinoplanes couchii]